ncbi:MAG: ABC transporter permease [Anaerolineales bacterium]|nr:ABC transporter permease [Anaerolineales bacterium]
MNALRRFLASRANRLAAALILLVVGVAAAAPLLAPVRPAGAQTDPGNVRYQVKPQPPDDSHLLGTVAGGADVYTVVIWGARDALRFGLVVTAATAVIGITVGAVGGYFGGWVNTLLMRLTDAFLAFPAIASVWMFSQVLFQGNPESPAWWQRALSLVQASPVMLALITFSWMPYARLINANVIRLKALDFVEAAHAMGAGPLRIIVRHLLPNALAPAVVLAARDVGGMVILAAAFTFIGVGFGGSQWGTLLAGGRDYVIGLSGNPLRYWWTFLPATLAIVFFGLGWNLLGDGLNRMLDPRAARLGVLPGSPAPAGPAPQGAP